MTPQTVRGTTLRIEVRSHDVAYEVIATPKSKTAMTAVSVLPKGARFVPRCVGYAGAKHQVDERECHLMTLAAYRGAKPSIGGVGEAPRSSTGETSNDGSELHRRAYFGAKSGFLRPASTPP